MGGFQHRTGFQAFQVLGLQAKVAECSFNPGVSYLGVSFKRATGSKAGFGFESCVHQAVAAPLWQPSS